MGPRLLPLCGGVWREWQQREINNFSSSKLDEQIMWNKKRYGKYFIKLWEDLKYVISFYPKIDLLYNKFINASGFPRHIIQFNNKMIVLFFVIYLYS